MIVPFVKLVCLSFLWQQDLSILQIVQINSLFFLLSIMRRKGRVGLISVSRNAFEKRTDGPKNREKEGKASFFKIRETIREKKLEEK